MVPDEQAKSSHLGSGPIESISLSISRPRPLLAGRRLAQRLNAARHIDTKPITSDRRAPPS